MPTTEWLKTPEAQAILARSQAHLRGRITKVIYKEMMRARCVDNRYPYARVVYKQASDIAAALQSAFPFRLSAPLHPAARALWANLDREEWPGSPAADTASFKRADRA